VPIGQPALNGTVEGAAQPAVDAGSRAAILRAAVARAASVREAAVRAIRADYVFAAAWALVFVSVSIWLVWRDWPSGPIRFVSEAAVGAVGIAAFAMNFKTNDRVIQTLATVPPEDAETPLPGAPYGYNVLKWLAIAVAVGCCLASAR
jgi:hypothetical protein